jgi:hypothetical protein
VKDGSGVLVGSEASIKGKSVLRRVSITLGVEEGTVSMLYFDRYSEEHGKEAVSRADDGNIT